MLKNTALGNLVLAQILDECRILSGWTGWDGSGTMMVVLWVDELEDVDVVPWLLYVLWMDELEDVDVVPWLLYARNATHFNLRPLDV